MKKSLLFLFMAFLVGLSANATDYYIASNGNDNNNGTSQNTPWRTIEKINRFNFKAGDRILFRRGDTFYGRIEGSNAGRAGNPVTYSAYGAGNKPVITGFTEVNSWNNLGGNIWESSTAVSSLPSLNTVLVKGVNTPMGRYPNAEPAYPFYPNFLHFQSHSGSGVGYTSLTSKDLNGSTNWNGAEIVVRANQWLLDRQKVVNHSGNTIAYNGQAPDFHGNNFGFFIQNDPRTLDVQNEWYYNPSSKKIRIYSTGYPSQVQVASVDTLFNSNYNFGYKVYTVVENLRFTGANTTAISFNGNGGKSLPVVRNCDIAYVGDFGITLSGLSDANIEDNYISNCGSSSVWHSNGTNITIKGNTIVASGVISVYKPNDYNGSAIALNSPNSLVQYNSIDSSAYCGIKFYGANIEIRNNFINHSNLIRGDGGGIYTAYQNQSGKVIDGNIILNSIGNGRGTPNNSYYAFGLYIDELGHDITISNNTVANCSAAGFFLHDTRKITAFNNTIYNNGTPGWSNSNLFIQGDAGRFTGVMRDHNFTNNILFAKNNSQYALKYYSEDNSNTVWNFGALDYNYYIKPTSPGTAIQSWQNSNVLSTMTLAQWKPFSGKDANSKESPKTISNENEIRFEYNATRQSKTISLDANYIDARGNSYKGSITLEPYSSAVLIRDGALQSQPPVANAGSPQTITLPKNNVVLNGNGNVPGGTIQSYKWSKKSGPNTGKIVDPVKATTEVTELTEGVYVFELEVTDNSGAKAVSEVEITVKPSANLLPASNPTNVVHGINYKYYEGSAFDLVPDFTTLKETKSGSSDNISLEDASRAEKFAFEFEGFIEVPQDGQYTFYLSSDDGSLLYIDGQLIVDNDGLHGMLEKSGSVGLQAGKHAIKIGYFQQTGSKVLDVSYSGPGLTKTFVPNTALFRPSDAVLLPSSNPVNITNGLNYDYFEETNYSVLPDFLNIEPEKSGTTNNFDLSVAVRAEQFAINYSGYINIPSDGQYTFYTASDDGSNLYIDDSLIVDNDGLHGWVEKSGTIGLKAGKHRISVGFFQGYGDKTLEVNYSGPGVSKRRIPSSELYRTIITPLLLDPVNPSNTLNGVNFEYYEGNNYSAMPDFDKLTPTRSGFHSGFDISVADRSEQFAIKFTGYIDVPVDGQYTFYTGSDDGSMLYIGNKPVVNNDGLHGWVEQSGTIGLKAGKHEITVMFFQATGGKSLDVYYEGPGISKRVIPAASLSRNSTLGNLYPAVNAFNVINGIDYSYIEGNNFTRMPLFSSFNPKKVGVSNNFNLSVANREEGFAINYTGLIEVPADGEYTFYTGSDDGSMLYIDHMLVVDNNGLHGWQERSGKIGLKAGKHYISVEFFQATGGKKLDVYYSGPGISKRAIPSSVLYRDPYVLSLRSVGINGNAMASSGAIKDPSLNEIGIKAYPNPFVNTLMVSLNGEAGEFDLQMLDALGRTLWTRKGSKNEGFYQQSINTSSLQKGIYYLKVIQNDQSSVIKLVK